MVTIVPPVSAFPASPLRSDMPTFSARAEVRLTHDETVFQPEITAFRSAVNTLAGELMAASASAAQAAVDADANGTAHVTAAGVAAAAAAAAAANAVATAGAAKWVSGTYADGAAVWSPVTYFAYRNKGAGSRTVDPSIDTTNWVTIAPPNTVAEIGSLVSGGDLTTNTNYAECNGATLVAASNPSVAGVLGKTPVPVAYTVNGDGSVGLGVVSQDKRAYTVNGLVLLTSTGSTITSLDDGVTWRQASLGTAPISGVAYGGGRWVVTTQTTATYYSTDGITWNAGGALSEAPALRNSNIYGCLSSIAFGNGQFVVLSGITDGRLWTSPDGATWTVGTYSYTGTSLVGNGMACICYGNGYFVVGGYYNSGNTTCYVSYSTTGNSTSFSSAAISTNYGSYWGVVCNGSVFVASPFIAGSAYQYFCKASNPATWVSQPIPTTRLHLGMWVGPGGNFVAYCYSSATPSVGRYALSSPDGVSWTETALTGPMVYGVSDTFYTGSGTTRSFPCKLGNTIIYGGCADQWHYIYSTDNGATLLQGLLPVAGGYSLFAASGSTFVFCPNGGGATVYTSTDGISWTARTGTGVPNTAASLWYVGAYFYILNSSVTVYRSTDGITWTSTATCAADIPAFMAYGGGKYVAIPNSAAGSQYAYSSDGITFTSTATSPGAANPTVGVVWDGTYFVALFVNASQSYTRRSTDGVTWAAQVAVTGSTSGNAIYCFAAGVYFVADASGTNYLTIDGTASWVSKGAGWDTSLFGANSRGVAVIGGTLIGVLASYLKIIEIPNYQALAAGYSAQIFKDLSPWKGAGTNYVIAGCMGSVSILGNAMYGFKSANGTSWTHFVPRGAQALTLMYSDGANYYVTSQAYVFTTTDFVNYTLTSALYFPGGAPTLFTFGASTMLTVYAGGAYKSADGCKTLTLAKQPDTGKTFNGLAFANSRFVMSQVSTTAMYSSTDATAWTGGTFTLSGVVVSWVEYTGSLYLAATNGGIMSSADLVTWTTRATGSVNDIRKINSNIVAFSNNSAATKTSLDGGLTWTSYTAGLPANYGGCYYDATEGILVIAPYASGNLMLSRNGIYIYPTDITAVAQTLSKSVWGVGHVLSLINAYAMATYNLASASTYELPAITAARQYMRIK